MPPEAMMPIFGKCAARFLYKSGLGPNFGLFCERSMQITVSTPRLFRSRMWSKSFISLIFVQPFTATNLCIRSMFIAILSLW